MGIVDDLEFRLETISKKIERTHAAAKDVEKNPKDRKKVNLLRAMTVNLDDLFTEFDEVCTKLAVHYKKQVPPIEKDLQTSFADFENRFYEVKAIVMSLVSDGESSSSVPMLSITHAGEASTVAPVSLPKLKLIEFSGNLLEWPSFHDMFLNSVHQQQMSPIHKFMHLKGCLVGEARSLISSFRITAANYQVAWDLLIERYNDPNRLSNAYLEALFDLPVIPREANRLRSLSSSLTEYTGGLSALGHNVDQWSYPMLFLFRRKLSNPLRERWEEHAISLVVPEIKDFIKFLENEVKVLESSKPISLDSSKAAGQSSKKHFNKSSGTTSLVTSTENQNSCPCGRSHDLVNCPKFDKMVVGTRLRFVKGKGLCLGCFSNNHVMRDCHGTPCGSCQGKHHESLCFKKHKSQANASGVRSENVTSPGESKSPPSSPSSDEVKSYQTSASAPSFGSVVMLATVQAYAVGNEGIVHTVTVLIDTASQGTFVTEDCIRRLGLDYHCHNTPIFGLGHSQAGTSKGLVNFSIVSKDSNSVKLHVTAMVVEHIANCPKLISKNTSWPHIAGLRLADPEYYRDRSVDILLGSEWYAKVVIGAPIVGPEGAPDVMHTVFGYCLLGRVQVNGGAINVFCSTFDDGFEERVDKLLRRFWEVEEPPSKPCLSEDEQKCVEFFKSTITRRDNGRYIVRLPFKDPPPELGESYALARRRYYSLENRLRRNPALYDEYRKFMRDYLNQHHMTLARHPPNPGKHYYIPHHCIFKDDDLSRFRVVFDCSMKTTNGVSLNQALHSGPKLQQNIIDVILRFRLFFVCLVADIRQMYRNIDISEQDYDFQRIFWRFDPQDKLNEYTLTTVTYGVNASPFLALASLRSLVEDEGKNYPQASQVILENTFVDDMCTSVRSIDEALSLQKELADLLARGRFSLRKWMSNRPEILADVPEIDCAINPNIFSFRELDSENIGSAILGLAWNPVTDVLSFKSRIVTDKRTSKRIILSQVSKLYDPLGFIAPVTFWGRWLIQHLWQQGYDWDEKPNDAIIERWSRFAADLPQLSKFELPRWVQLDSAFDVQLHGFSDSSERGYAGVVYLRITLASGDITTSLLVAKSKVAPVQKISIPRLELMGALLMTNLLMYAHRIVQPHCNLSAIVAWCDSTVALQWIKSSPHRWKTYVANRVTKIQEQLAPSHFRYVPTDCNPSDLASRGAFPSDLIENELWKFGPKWLRYPLSEWPSDITDQSDRADRKGEVEQEMRVATLALQTQRSSTEWLLRFSSFSRLMKLVAYWLRYFRFLRNPREHPFVVRAPSFAETRAAIIRLVYLVQREEFAKEIKILQKGSHKTPALFRKLSPFIDSEGVIRVGGRLRKTKLPFQRKHPMLLPKSHHLTQIIIDHYHLKYFHAGPLHVHCLIQDNFWILNAREVIRHRISKCVSCFRTKPKEANPKMGELPRSRLQPVSPFYSTGCDYGGPYNLLLARSRKPTTYKGYICLFVCFTTRAIHLELVSDLTTDAFIAALRRFIARRGAVCELYSDNATNFVGAKRKLGAWFDIIESPKSRDRIERELLHHNIEWKMSAPGSPHLNGLMEAGIKSTKTYLKKVIGDQILSYEEFSTILTQVEAIVNSRPLSPISSDPNDLRALTPGHFLLQRPAFVLEPLAPNDLTKRYHLLQKLVKSFWEQWHHDYLCTLQTRSKWTDTSENLKIGDMVLLKEPNLDPCHWRLGRIIRVFPGDDGIVRVAEIKTSRGTYSRHVRKLCPLPFNSQ